MDPAQLQTLVHARTHDPDAIVRAAAARRQPAGPLDTAHGRTLIIAADHTARGTLKAGARADAMADRADMLDRLLTALARPGVDGLLGTPDVVEDLLLLGALEGKAVYGSMNRGGLAGASFELDDRFTAYDADAIADGGLQGGKMLLRIDLADASTAPTLQRCAEAVTELARRKRIAMVEPFMAARAAGGGLTTDLTPDGVIKSAAIAAALGVTSAYTWLKLPVVDEMERAIASTTLPVVLLGGEVADDQDAMFARWQAALALPTVVGLTVGRSLLYPPDDDVAAAVDIAAGLVGAAAQPAG